MRVEGGELCIMILCVMILICFLFIISPKIFLCGPLFNLGEGGGGSVEYSGPTRHVIDNLFQELF